MIHRSGNRLTNTFNYRVPPDTFHFRNSLASVCKMSLLKLFDSLPVKQPVATTTAPLIDNWNQTTLEILQTIFLVLVCIILLTIQITLYRCVRHLSKPLIPAQDHQLTSVSTISFPERRSRPSPTTRTTLFK